MYKQKKFYGLSFIIGLAICTGIYGMQLEVEQVTGWYALEVLKNPFTQSDYAYGADLKFEEGNYFCSVHKHETQTTACLALHKQAIENLNTYLTSIQLSKDTLLDVPCILRKPQGEASPYSLEYEDRKVSLKITFSDYVDFKTITAKNEIEKNHANLLAGMLMPSVEESMADYDKNKQKKLLYAVCKIGAWGLGALVVLYYAVQLRHMENFVLQWLQQR